MELQPGDHVVHQVHGPGTVIEVTTRDMPGGPREYVSLQLATMTLLVPLDEVDDSGLRQPIDAADAHSIIELLGKESLDDPGHRARRSRNRSRIASGEAEGLAKVVRSLKALRQESGRPLRYADKNHLRQALRQLVGELALALGIDETEAEEMVLDAVADDEPESADS
ncbi:CarD family transcriptional regulator [Euzebya tangerina]|uniref:CarD family transcriptional regulator n=1 Tax=Euzebya tangerina TaxID=591198 RepID=UPI000E30C92E|nr:CarD family transcriptional regulator [Euzebya tangerina]